MEDLERDATIGKGLPRFRAFARITVTDRFSETAMLAGDEPSSISAIRRAVWAAVHFLLPMRTMGPNPACQHSFWNRSNVGNFTLLRSPATGTISVFPRLGPFFVEGRVTRKSAALDALFRDVIARHAFDPADPPLIATIDRSVFSFGERGLRKHAGLHRHIVLDDDYFATDEIRYGADGLRDEDADRVAHHGHDSDLHAAALLERRTGIPSAKRIAGAIPGQMRTGSQSGAFFHGAGSGPGPSLLLALSATGEVVPA